ncbi:MAG: LysR substrate-binding domain-containing protein, partial [Notoacmeibacter sp.]
MSSLDLDLLKAFAAIIDTGSFTRAGERLGLTQSAITLKLRRLEAVSGRTLMTRNAKAVALTEDGAALLPFARRMIEMNDAALAELRGPKLKGTVRLGTPEDFATAHLPEVLAGFAAEFPDVALEVTCDLTLNLLELYRNGAFDMILIKREPYGAFGDGVAVWRERLVWARGPKVLKSIAALPLVVAPQPCVYRKRATQALDKAKRSWRIVYTSPSQAGAEAAVRAGLGVIALPEQMVPDDFVILTEGMPDLAETEIALLAREPLTRPAAKLRTYIIQALEAEAAKAC